MTLSNKILVIFFGFILTYTLAAFVEIRISGESRILNEENAITETIALDGVKYIVFDDQLDHWISMSASDQPRLDMRSKSGDMLSKLKYKLENDTLYIREINDEDNRFDLMIYVPKSGFTGFKSSAAYVELTSMKQQWLSINQVNGRVDLGANVEVEKLIVDLKEDATFEMTDSRADTVSIQMNNSNLRLYGKTHLLKGVLANGSSIYANNVDEMQLKKDKGSFIQIMN